eukprot:CAMPEP_0116876826 /NCGR_PEP_ID=MMETSP0463-20121206/8688_1 /TAXON_ID=181622 /ORGANISM="Strombidinopsis sp, Strain SopsisLIS2011" /LENGTH=67 /DNA_ID=CAMNT_0004523659 /DNA_START=1120 /DNA_END=1323 /DNA_ORIENTATION=+
MMPNEESAHAANSEYFNTVITPALNELKDGACFVEDPETNFDLADDHDRPRDHTTLVYQAEPENQEN